MFPSFLPTFLPIPLLILAALFLILFLSGLALRRLTWHDCIPMLALLVIVTAFPPAILIFFLPFPFVLIFLVPDRKASEEMGRLEMFNALIFVLLAVFIFGSIYAISNGATRAELGRFDLAAVVATAISSIALLLKRTLRSYLLTAFNALMTVGIYLFWVISAPAELAEDLVMRGVTETGITAAGYFILVVLFLRFVLTLSFAVKMLSNKLNTK